MFFTHLLVTWHYFAVAKQTPWRPWCTGICAPAKAPPSHECRVEHKAATSSCLCYFTAAGCSYQLILSDRFRISFYFHFAYVSVWPDRCVLPQSLNNQCSPLRSAEGTSRSHTLNLKMWMNKENQFESYIKGSSSHALLRVVKDREPRSEKENRGKGRNWMHEGNSKDAEMSRETRA